MTPMLEAALSYAARGWPVLPCAERDKRPLTRRGVKDASLDPAQLRDWWARWPAANVAVAGGFGLTVVDVDDMGALDALTWLAMCDTARVSTSRGQHVYFSGTLPTCTPHPGVDIRGGGAYVLAPPSTHPSGAQYRWLADREPAPLPAELVALVGQTAQAGQMAQTAPDTERKTRPYVSLPRLARRILRADPTALARYGTRSEADRALLVSLANSGASLELARALYTRSQHDKHLDPAARDFERRFAAEWQRAKERAGEDRPEVARARELARQVARWAADTPRLVNAGRQAQESARRVLIAHCERAERAGAGQWQLSARDAVQTARVSLPTVVAAHRRLVEAGLLRQIKAGYNDLAATWGFGKFAEVLTLTHIRPVVRKCSKPDTTGPADTVRADAFEHCALGRNVWQTYDALVRLETATLPELAEAAGWTVRTTERHLLTLAAHGLAAPLEAGDWAAVRSASRLAQVGESLGGTARAQQRAARIDRERQAHRARLAAFRPVRRAAAGETADGTTDSA